MELIRIYVFSDILRIDVVILVVCLGFGVLTVEGAFFSMVLIKVICETARASDKILASINETADNYKCRIIASFLLHFRLNPYGTIRYFWRLFTERLDRRNCLERRMRSNINMVYLPIINKRISM